MNPINELCKHTVSLVNLTNIGVFLFLKQMNGEVTYNGYKLDEFIPQKTASYISQYDLHIPEMTVRETLDFSARLQGVGCREGKNRINSLTCK